MHWLVAYRISDSKCIYRLYIRKLTIINGKINTTVVLLISVRMNVVWFSWKKRLIQGNMSRFISNWRVIFFITNVAISGHSLVLFILTYFYLHYYMKIVHICTKWINSYILIHCQLILLLLQHAKCKQMYGSPFCFCSSIFPLLCDCVYKSGSLLPFR